jgi:hypothetical protein
VYSIIGLLCICATLAPGVAASSVSDRPVVLSHDLAVELRPPTHELIGRDQIDVELPIRATFSLVIVMCLL